MNAYFWKIERIITLLKFNNSMNRSIINKIDLNFTTETKCLHWYKCQAFENNF